MTSIFLLEVSFKTGITALNGSLKLEDTSISPKFIAIDAFEKTSPKVKAESALRFIIFA